MKKLVVLGAGSLAAAAIAFLGTGVATSQPADPSSMLNVVGEPYAKAVQILRSQGVRTSFGGSTGSKLPQSQCLVKSQKYNSSRKMVLILDCTQEAADELQQLQSGGGTGGTPAGPNVGSNGVTTVQATPVGPQPGMNIPGA